MVGTALYIVTFVEVRDIGRRDRLHLSYDNWPDASIRYNATPRSKSNENIHFPHQMYMLSGISPVASYVLSYCVHFLTVMLQYKRPMSFGSNSIVPKTKLKYSSRISVLWKGITVVYHQLDWGSSVGYSFVNY